MTMICEVFRVARSTVYWTRKRLEAAPPASAKRRGPRTELTDEELVVEIRTVLQESAFLSEGHQKVRARLAFSNFVEEQASCTQTEVPA